MGILDDLQMGLGLKERTEDYDARTARNIALTQAYGDDDVAKMRARQNYTTTSNPFGGTSPFNYGDFYRSAYNAPQGNAQSFLRRQGGEGYSPSIMADNRPFFQRALFSQQGTPSPTRYGIGPVKLDGPLRIPSILGMITGALSSFGNRGIPTVSADGGPMRVRGPLDAGLNRFESRDARSRRAALAAGYPTPDLSPRDILPGVTAAGILTDDDMGLPTGPVPDFGDRESLIPTLPDESGLPELTLPGVDDPTYDEFMVHQRDLEERMGYDPLSEAQYRTMYNRMLSR